MVKINIDKVEFELNDEIDLNIFNTDELIFVPITKNMYTYLHENEDNDEFDKKYKFYYIIIYDSNVDDKDNIYNKIIIFDDEDEMCNCASTFACGGCSFAILAIVYDKINKKLYCKLRTCNSDDEKNIIDNQIYFYDIENFKSILKIIQNK